VSGSNSDAPKWHKRGLNVQDSWMNSDTSDAAMAGLK
jgi:hypothetical protein